MVRGSCLCGGIGFEAASIALLTHCHCSMCRKAHGSAFGSFASVRTEDFRFVHGEELVQFYESTPGNRRAFCRVCGSNAPVRASDGETFVVPAGLLDDDPGVRPALHMFVGSKAPWWEIEDALPRFDAFVPGFGPGEPEPA